MKKRTILLIFGLIFVSLLATGVFAQEAVETLGEVFKGIKNGFDTIVSALFGDVNQPAGKERVFIFITFIGVTLGLYELFRFLKLKKGLAFVVAALLGVVSILVIPAELLVSLYSTFGALVTLIMLALVNAIPTVATLLIPKDKWQGKAFALIIWIVFAAMAFSLLTDDQKWEAVIQTLYILGWIVWILFSLIWGGASSAIPGGGTLSKVYSSFSKRLSDATLVAVGAQMKLDIKKVKDLIPKIAAQGDSVSWTDSGAYNNNFGKQMGAELTRIKAELDAVKTKQGYDASTMDPLVDSVRTALSSTGQVSTGGFHAPMGLINWLRDGGALASSWPNPTSSTYPDLKAEIKGSNGVVQNLQTLVSVLNNIDQQIFRKVKA